MTKRKIVFCNEDFDPILEEEGIDPSSVTEDEWRKFTDRFLDGTHWAEIAGYACDAIKAQREDTA